MDLYENLFFLLGSALLGFLVMLYLFSQNQKSKQEDWQLREFPNLSVEEGGLVAEFTCDTLPLSLFVVCFS
jgi:hypothetical protein